MEMSSRAKAVLSISRSAMTAIGSLAINFASLEENFGQTLSLEWKPEFDPVVRGTKKSPVDQWTFTEKRKGLIALVQALRDRYNLNAEPVINALAKTHEAAEQRHLVMHGYLDFDNVIGTVLRGGKRGVLRASEGEIKRVDTLVIDAMGGFSNAYREFIVEVNRADALESRSKGQNLTK